MLFKTSLFYAFLTLFGWLIIGKSGFSAKPQSVKTLDNFQGRQRIKDVVAFIPPYFHEHLQTNIDEIISIIEPFNKKKGITDVFRYVTPKFPYSSIIIITRHEGFDRKNYVFDKNKLKAKQIKHISTKNKPYGRKGLLIRFEQFSHSMYYEKWFAIFGNSYQTSMVAVVVPKFRSERVLELLQRTLIYANLSP